LTQFKRTLKYLLALVVAGLLLWLVFKQVDIREMINRLGEVNYFYVAIAMSLAIFSYWLRGYRWKLMLQPPGYEVSSTHAFLAMNVGYLANLFLPRMGEITRCGVLKRTDNVNMTVSIGSVVAERIIDVLSLMLITGLSLLLEFQLLGDYLKGVFSSQFEGISGNLPLIYMAMGIFGAGIIITYFLIRANKERLKKVPLFLKIRSLLYEVVQGLTSINRIEKKLNFWVSTVLLWVVYYVMTYLVVFAIPETSGLSMTAGLTILVTGSFGMATPVQGGIGAFHALVSGVLVLYGIALEDGILYATVLHTSQMIGVIVVGGLSLLITLFIGKKRQKKSIDNGEEPGEIS
jgi:uncharacterized protein (TIRG00374 family)